MDQIEIEIYTSPNCPECVMAKKLLKDLNVNYIEYNVIEKPEKTMEMVRKSGCMRAPVLLIGESIISGFNKQKILEILKELKKI